MKEVGGKRGELVGLDLPSVGGGTVPTVGQLFGSEGKHFRLKVKQMIRDGLNWMRITQTILSTAIHTPDRARGPLEGPAAGSWSAAVVEQTQARSADDCGETAWGTWERRSWGERPVEENEAAVEARRHCESCVGGGGITVAALPTASTRSWTIERLTRA